MPITGHNKAQIWRCDFLDRRAASCRSCRRRCQAVAAPEVADTGPAGKNAVILNKYSRVITQPKSQGASQAMLYAVGLQEADMDKPQVLLEIFAGVRLTE